LGKNTHTVLKRHKTGIGDSSTAQHKKNYDGNKLVQLRVKQTKPRRRTLLVHFGVTQERKFS